MTRHFCMPHELDRAYDGPPEPGRTRARCTVCGRRWLWGTDDKGRPMALTEPMIDRPRRRR